MKVLALYLPQFHEIKENNEWWGEGFTEWTHFKKDNKYRGQLKPLNDNYYNLLDKETVKWQTELMQKYSVYGFCYYHYWFKGKKLLEKPAENLLEWKDIDQKFCFDWANHNWKRVASGKTEILIEQTYGNESDWLEHFEYLKPFFLDERYIKVENKPLFLIHNSFSQKNDIVKLFDEKCKELGFDGIHYVETVEKTNRISDVSPLAGGIFLREPTVSQCSNRAFIKRGLVKINRAVQKKLKSVHLIPKFRAKRLYKISIRELQNAEYNGLIYPGAFAMWDSTYRHGANGFRICPTKKANLKKYMQNVKDIGEEKGSKFMIFNAWNEWAEGMILEPSNLYGYEFLECIKEVFSDSFDE